MQKDYTNTFLLNTLDLPVITDLNTLSNYLGLSKRLIYLLSLKTENYYKRFFIPKKNGKQREILSPSYSLKLVQKCILTDILEKINITDEAMAFKKGENKGIKQNADYHKYSLYLLEMDVKDFFPSIKRSSVFFLFKNIGYNKFISNILANLCTYKGYLPQGGVTSPYLSNLIAYKMDRRLQQLCCKRDILYTRYADDLTFSCNNKDTLKKIKPIIKEIINDEGFVLNNSKTRLLSPKSHKVINGITVNDNKVKANKMLKKKVRAMIHSSIVSCDYSKNDVIRGYISFVNYVEEGYKEKIINYINKLATEKEYRYFEDIVQAYNENKLFKEAKNMIYEELNPFDDYVYGVSNDLYLYEINECRNDFLKKHGYTVEENIIDYENDDFPF